MRHKRLFASLAAAAVLAFGVLVAAPEAAQATGLVKCDVNADGTEDNDKDVAIFVGAYDPIVYHNVDSEDPSEAQPHPHDFFGNRRIITDNDPNGMTYAYMRTFAGGGGFDATSCRIPEDTAAYWAPSLVCTKVSSSCAYVGQRIGVRQISAYYRGFAGQTTHAGSQAIPAGARLVAYQSGNLGGGPGFGLTGWTCGQNSAVTQGQDTIPDCSASSGGPGDSATAHINFPSCWNGVAPGHPGDTGAPGGSDTTYGDTRDNNYGSGGPGTSDDFVYPANKTACPASHPIEVVQLRQTYAYAYTGDGTDVALTSDHGAPAGSTMHVDFWNTWDQDALVSFVQRCIQTAEEANCKP